ncbi:SMP-30/gluconolactonase/LRE family protein [Novosphingobium lindaniclasticum]|jgi:sugar lactone lactonase YvrE
MTGGPASCEGGPTSRIGGSAIASGTYLEGLIVNTADDAIWYSDVLAGGVYAVGRDGSPLATFNPDRRWTGGLMLNADGRVLSSGPGGIMWNDPVSQESGWLLKEIEGAPINGINEMAPDGEGGIIFGTCDIAAVEQGVTPRSTSIYRMTRAGLTAKLADEIGFANGIAFNTATRTLFCNDTFCGTWAFDVDTQWRLANRRLILEKEDVDGLALDAEGTLWVTGFRSDFLTCLSPSGEILARIAVPAGAITQVRFGGTDMRDLFLTAVPATGGDTLKDGGEIAGAHSFLLKCRSHVAGAPIPRANFVRA